MRLALPLLCLVATACLPETHRTIAGAGGASSARDAAADGASVLAFGDATIGVPAATFPATATITFAAVAQDVGLTLPAGASAVSRVYRVRTTIAGAAVARDAAANAMTVTIPIACDPPPVSELAVLVLSAPDDETARENVVIPADQLAISARAGACPVLSFPFKETNALFRVVRKGDELAPFIALPPLPDELAALTVTTRNATSLVVSWPRVDSAHGYAAAFAAGAAPPTCAGANAEKIPQNSAGPLTLTINGLTAGTAYGIRVCAANARRVPDVSAGQTVAASTVTESEMTPADVKELTAVPHSGTELALAWTDSPAGASFVVAVAETTAPKTCADAAAVNATVGADGKGAATVGGLTKGKTYGIRLCARSAGDETRVSAGATTSAVIANYWQSLPTQNAPSARQFHTATASSAVQAVIVWGGDDGHTALNDGARLDATGATWTAIAAAPAARTRHTAVASAASIVVFGGQDETEAYPVQGYKYDATVDSWAAIATAGAPDGRVGHVAALIGAVMIVCGGENGGGFLATCGRYNIASNTWLAVASAGAPSARADAASAVVQGRLVIWGGRGAGGALADGGVYDPAANSWTALAAADAAAARAGDSFAAADGRYAYLLPGLDDGGQTLAAARLGPVLTSTGWSALGAPFDAVAPRRGGASAAAGATVFYLFGGVGANNALLADGWRFEHNVDASLIKATALPSGGPSAREHHTLTPFGAAALIFGGKDAVSVVGDGAIFWPK